MTMEYGGNNPEFESVSTDEQNNTIHWVPAGSTGAEATQIINDAGSNSRIVFEAGSYPNLTEPIKVEGVSNVELVGPGWGTEFRVDGSVEINAIEVLGDPTQGTFLDSVTVKGFYVNGNKNNVTDGGDALNQCGIYATNVRNLDVLNNHAYNTLYSNIRVSRCPKAEIAHNRAELSEDNTNTSDLPSDNISIKNPMEGWSIHHNVCLDCGHQAIETSSDSSRGTVHHNYIARSSSAAIQTHFAKETSITENVIYDCESVGIFAGNPNHPIANNIIVDVGGSGINIKDSGTQEVPVVGNTILNTSVHGIFANTDNSSMAIGYNTVRKADGDGIRLGEDSSTFSTHTVGFNILLNCRNGIYLENNRNTKLAFNRVRDCTDGIVIDSNCLVCSIWGPSLAGNGNAVTDNGTKTDWNGVMGGGLLGGIDLSSTAGFYDAQEGMSDGTATGFPEFTKAIWDDANSQWVRVDGQATV